MYLHIKQYIATYVCTYIYNIYQHIQSTYCIVQNFQGTKLSWLGHYVTKKFVFALKQHPQVPKHFKIHGKTFAIQANTTKP